MGTEQYREIEQELKEVVSETGYTYGKQVVVYSHGDLYISATLPIRDVQQIAALAGLMYQQVEQGGVDDLDEDEEDDEEDMF